jgi:hypothetical protein
MARIQKLFLLLIIIGPLHMAEQLVTNIEEFYMIRNLIAGYYAWFDPAAADWATVALVTIVWTIVSLMLYAVLNGGLSSLCVFGFIGLFGASEVHHVIEAITKGAYDPGVISSVPYAYVGALLVAAVWKEFRRIRVAAPERAAVPV